MDESTLEQYLADDPPTIVPLTIKPHFEALNEKEKHYAHYISRAAFSGTRINFRQVSPESESIYDFILELNKVFAGRLDWKSTTVVRLRQSGSFMRGLEMVAVLLGFASDRNCTIRRSITSILIGAVALNVRGTTDASLC